MDLILDESIFRGASQYVELCVCSDRYDFLAIYERQYWNYSSVFSLGLLWHISCHLAVIILEQRIHNLVSSHVTGRFCRNGISDLAINQIHQNVDGSRGFISAGRVKII